MTSAPPLRFVVGRSRMIRVALIAIALASMAVTIGMDFPDWVAAIAGPITGWYAGRCWIRYEDDYEGRVIARDAEGAWTVDGEPASLEHYDIVGPIVSLRFRTGERKRAVSIVRDAVSRDDYRRLLVHLRGVHRPDPAIR